MIVKNFVEFLNESQSSSFFDTSNDDYLTSRAKENDAEIRKSSPAKGMWVNMKGEFGDVWHEIVKVYEPSDYYASAYIYTRVDSKSAENKIESVYYHKIRKISETLPSNARIVMCSHETRNN